MMKKRIKYILLLLLLFIGSIPSENVSAKTFSKKVIMREYKKFLANERFDETYKIDAFGLIDLNNDGISELYLDNGAHPFEGGIAYWDGEKVEVFSTGHNGYFYLEEVYKTGFIFKMREGRSPGSQWYYKLKNGKMKEAAEIEEYIDMSDTSGDIKSKYKINGKRVSWSKFEKFENKIKNRGTREREVNWIDNNSKNRKKYLRS